MELQAGEGARHRPLEDGEQTEATQEEGNVMLAANTDLQASFIQDISAVLFMKHVTSSHCDMDL